MEKITELSQTVELMWSKDYKERFIAEYLQLKIRLTKLKDMLKKWDANELNFTPTCPRKMYDYQLTGMNLYMDILKERAKIEEIDLSKYDA